MAGFRMTPSAVHGHANRIAERGDQVSQAGSRVGGAGLHGEALGQVGSGTAGRHQQLVGQFQEALSTSGSRLHGHANLLHDGANSTTSTDSAHADKLRSIGTPDRAPHTQHPTADVPKSAFSQSGTKVKAPPNIDEFRSSDGWVHMENMSSEDYQKFAPHWQHLMKPEPNNAWFWSGGHVIDSKFDPKGTRIDPETGRPTTEQHYLGSIEKPTAGVAGQNGGNTLEGLLRDHKIQMPGWADKNPNTEQMWKDASTTLAHNAQGVVHVALPNTPGKTSGWPNHGDEIASRRPNNVFDMDEFPILRHNPDVTKIVAHDSDYGTEDTLWERGQL